MSINKQIIVGNLAKDPEVKILDSGKKVATFSVGVTEKYTKDQETISETEWFNVTAWGKTADFVESYLVKGQQVYIEGSSKTKKYVDKEGANKVYHYVRCNVVQCLGGIKKLKEQEDKKYTPHKEPTQTNKNENINNDEVDDLPF